MIHLMRRIVCLLVAVTLVASILGGAGFVAPAAAMTGSADMIVKSEAMNCGACAKMPGALGGCTGGPCVVTGILVAANLTVVFWRAAYRACSAPVPRGCTYRPAIFPT
jgi:hypothetical protein